jgi:uncharacterized protein (TIGR02246 family)
MKRGLVSSMTTVAAAACLAMGSDTASEEHAIRAIPQQIVEGWSQGSGQAIADVYAEDGTLVAGDGTFRKGRSPIAEYHDRQFAGFLKGTRLTVGVKSIRLLSPNLALMQTEGGILWPGQQQPAAGNLGIQSFVVTKERGTWRVLLFQNTRILASSPRSNP